jgi:hypothetical protein
VVAGGQRAKPSLRSTGADLDQIRDRKLFVRPHVADDLRSINCGARRPVPVCGRASSTFSATTGRDAAVAKAIAAGAVLSTWRRLGKAPASVADKSVMLRFQLDVVVLAVNTGSRPVFRRSRPSNRPTCKRTGPPAPREPTEAHPLAHRLRAPSPLGIDLAKILGNFWIISEFGGTRAFFRVSGKRRAAIVRGLPHVTRKRRGDRRWPATNHRHRKKRSDVSCMSSSMAN